MVTEAFTNYDGKNTQIDEYEKELEKITKLLETLLEGHANVSEKGNNNVTLSKTFIGSISQVVRPGMEVGD